MSSECESVSVKTVFLAAQEVLDDRVRARGRKKVQRADQQHRAEQQNDEVPPETGNVPALAGAIFFCTSEPASARIGTIIRKRPINMARPSVVLYQGVLAVRPAKALPLFPVAGTEGVEHFAQAVRTVVVQAGQAPFAHRRPGRETRGWKSPE